MTSPEVIVFPDVEQLLIDWLTTELASRGDAVTVSTRVPNPRLDDFVRVIRTGGPVGNVFVMDNPTVTFERWSQTESSAAVGIQLVRGLVNSLPGRTIAGVPFYRVAEFSGPANLPDPDSAQIRYTYSASLHLRGFAA